MVPGSLLWFPGLYRGPRVSTMVPGALPLSWGSTMVPGTLPWFLGLYHGSWGSIMILGALLWPPGIFRGPQGSTMVVYFLLELSDAVLTPAANICPQ